MFFFWILFFSWLLAAITTNSNGIFVQKRVGRHGMLFPIYKLRTIHPITNNIDQVSAFLRKFKLDELPQLLNVIKGEMSFVGPRPDVPGYADKLTGEQKKILELRPGITSLASLKYMNEDELLKKVTDPIKYNDTVIYPDKVQLNLEYYYNRTFWGDIQILIKTMVMYCCSFVEL